MSFLGSPHMHSMWSRRHAPAINDDRTAREEGDVERQDGGHGREASGRSFLSNISGRLTNMREQDTEAERSRQSQRAHAMAERLLNDLNLWRGVSGPVRNDPAGLAGTGQAANGAGSAGQMSSMRKLTGKSRREREEGAALFGPNLANYFGSGSSSSGAIAGSTAAATAAAQNAEGSANDAAPSGADLNSAVGSLRRPRLGSRGRARGASLSGLGSWMSNVEAIDSVPSLNDTQTQPGLHHVMSQESLGVATASATTPATGSLAMAEGIEIDTLRRWIDRSRVGGTVEISTAEEVEHVRGDAGNPTTLCSTLQSYVNLKRNTVKLYAINPDTEAVRSANSQLKSPLSAASLQHPFSQMQSHAMHSPAPTHSIQFEYDCAAPFASVQVFVRASRKHGSWLTWTTAREALGLSTDLTIGAADDGESRFFGQRGPPPHVLGWPVHFARVRKGFSSTVKVNLALHLDMYAPPKSTESGESDNQASTGKGVSFTGKAPAAPTPALLIPETPGLDASRRLDDPVTPAATVQPVADPLNSTGSQVNARAEAVGSTTSGAPVEMEKEESKEARAARERAERETLKVAIVIETLDEDGKPLAEPNLQTTYLRVASLPIKGREMEAIEALGGPIEELAKEFHQQAGPVMDVAVAPDGANTMPSSTRRAWSIQVEGQEAEIGPHRFQLQELYGLSSRPPPPQQQQEMADQEGKDANDDELGASGDPMPPIDLHYGDEGGGATECLICLSSPPSTLLLPCTHGLCLDCAVQLRDTVKATRESERRRGRRPKRKYACPVCRRIYTSMLYLRAVDEKFLAQASIV